MNQENLQLALSLIPLELWNTCYMVFCASIVSFLIGLPLGILLVITGKRHIKESLLIHKILGAIINAGRSFPFAILMIALIPITRIIVGTSLGTLAAIVPLSVAAIPFVARVVEMSLKEVDKGLIEAATIMGSSTSDIIFKVLLPESKPSLILGFTTTVINLIGYSAMAGTMGGGGLGKVAIQYGYQRFNVFLIIITVILLIILVQGVQSLGNFWVHKITRQRGKGI